MKELVAYERVYMPVFFYASNILVKLASWSHMAEFLPGKVNQENAFPAANRYSKYTVRLGIFQSKAPQNKYRIDTS